MAEDRKPLHSWSPESVVWSTQFNDLRPRGVGLDEDQRFAQLQLELKTQALLVPRTLIRDSDVVNHFQLLEAIRRDADGVRAVLRHGAIVLSIRDDAASFAEVNERLGFRRAFPERYHDAKAGVATLDDLVAKGEVVLTEEVTFRKQFRHNLNKLLTSHFLSTASQDDLHRALELVTQQYGPEDLSLGALYDVLVRNDNHDPYGMLIQACRAAHSLAVPCIRGFPPSSADRDLPPDLVGFILGQAGRSIEEGRRWRDLYPPRILPLDALKELSWEEVLQIRRHEIEAENGYYEAATRVRAKVGSPEFDAEYEDYLRHLSGLLERIGRDYNVELVEWQAAILDQAVLDERQLARVLAWSVPILVAVGYALYTLSVVTPLAEAIVVGKGMEHLVDSLRRRQPSPLERLRAGMTVSPAASTLPEGAA